MKRTMTLVLALSALFTSSSVFAEIIFFTGPGPDTAIGYGVYGTGSPYGNGRFYESLAGQFTTTELLTIESVQGWMAAQDTAADFPAGPVQLHASIYDSVPANPAVYAGTLEPGAAIFSAPFDLILCANASQSSCPVGWQGPTGLSWTLDPGTYWVVFEGITGDTGWAGMPGPVDQPLENSLFLATGQTWSELYPGGFGVQITGTVGAPASVSEPSLGVLMLLGVFAGAAARRPQSPLPQ